MEFKDFTELVRQEVEKKAGGGYNIRLADATKNNGIVLGCITVSRKGCNISPVIYLDDFYGAYQDGTATIGMIADNVMDTYRRNKVGSINMDAFLDYDAIKHRIVYKLINTERNRELLEDIPHMPFHDLSIVFECFVCHDGTGNASIRIHNQHMKLWDVGREELFRAASANTPALLKSELKTMGEVLREIGMADFGNLHDSVPMYVLGNKTRVHGAACILYPGLLRNLAAACQSDLFIIPSSIHETLILPGTDPENINPIKEMIREVNGSAVREDEFLSDSLFIYEQGSNGIRML